MERLHALEHVSFLATGLLLWWPVAGSAPEWPRPGPPAQLLYLFLATIPMMAIAAPITLAEDLLYPAYAAAGRRGPSRPRADQELAGILMWVGGMFGYLVAGTVVFFRWAGPESPRGRRGPARPGGERRRMAPEARSSARASSAGLIGAAAVAMLILVFDVASGAPLQSPAILGSAIFKGIRDPNLATVSAGPVSATRSFTARASSRSG